jgi:hypothetical protein
VGGVAEGEVEVGDVGGGGGGGELVVACFITSVLVYI